MTEVGLPVETASTNTAAGEPFDRLKMLEIRVDWAREDVRGFGLRLGFDLLIGIALVALSAILRPELVDTQVATIFAPNSMVLFVATSIALAIAHLWLWTRAQRREVKAQLLLIKSDILAARLAARG